MNVVQMRFRLNFSSFLDGNVGAAGAAIVVALHFVVSNSLFLHNSLEFSLALSTYLPLILAASIDYMCFASHFVNDGTTLQPSRALAMPFTISFRRRCCCYC